MKCSLAERIDGYLPSAEFVNEIVTDVVGNAHLLQFFDWISMFWMILVVLNDTTLELDRF